MPKHGIEQHFVRPDRVYATGVWTPVAGFQPAEDAMQVAARFVAGGQGRTTLAGPQAEVQLLGWRSLRAASTLRERLDTFLANMRARFDAWRIRRELKMLPAPAQVTVDTSPRPSAPYPGAIPTQGAWAPAPQSPTSAAALLPRKSDSAPLLPAQAAAAQLAPGPAAFPATYWQDVIARGLPPMVASRGANDALRAWYGNRFPGQGY